MAVNQLIGEVQKSRKAFVAVDQERTRLTDEVQKRERLLARARNILGVLSLALALLSIYAWSKVHGDGLVWLEDVTGTLLYLSVPAVVFSVAALILVRLDLAPRWLERPAAAALEMAPGPLKSILSAMQRKKPDPPANA